MKKLIVLLLLLQGCSVVSHHELEHRCSDNCNKIIDKLKNYELDSYAVLSNIFKKEEEVCEEPIGTFNCAPASQ